ncbi:MAG: hypothetical protein WB758_07100 [Candidatus Sulfotelmatobacter sp.]|jgi:hypothetical protein
MAMRGVLVSLVAPILAATALAQSPAVSQTTNGAANASLGQIADGGAIVAELAKSVNARKSKAYDKIESRVTMDLLWHDKVVIPRGTKIVGRVTDARARTKDVPESTVKIAFDRVVWSGGREVPLKATIQALGAPMHTSAPGVSDVDFAGETGSRSSLGPNGMRRIQMTNPDSLRPAYAGRSVEEPDSSGPHKDSPLLGPFSQGVVGMKGITLSNTAQGSAISSTSENVHLSSGTQLVLHVAELQVLADSLLGTKSRFCP